MEEMEEMPDVMSEEDIDKFAEEIAKLEGKITSPPQPEKHEMDVKIEEFAAEFLNLVVKGNGTSIQNWSSRFFVDLGGVVASITVGYDVKATQGR